jgi:excisionase family DNA binding protein
MPVTATRPVAMEEPDERMLTAKEVANRLNFKNTRTIHHLAESGELQGYKIAGEWRFKQRDLDQFIEQRKY